MDFSKYSFLNRCLVRIPFFSFNDLQLIKESEKIINHPAFREALYITSNSLYDELYNKHQRDERTIMSMLRYYVRACTRSTPYGLFAGCSLASVEGEFSSIEVGREESYESYSRIDMNVLCEIIRSLDSDLRLRKELKYHVNSSLYRMQNIIRYIEYNVVEQKRKYVFSEVECDLYLDAIIDATSKAPLSIKEMVVLLADLGIDTEESNCYINSLIDEQILVSNLEPSVVGSDLLHQLYSNMPMDYDIRDDVRLLIELMTLCNHSKIGDRIGLYNEISKTIHDHFQYENTIPFHVDCKISVNRAVIGANITDTIKKGFYALGHLSRHQDNEDLKEFKERFYARYEEQEVLLPIALDPQIGVGFGKWTSAYGDMDCIIKGVVLPQKILKHHNELDNEVQGLLIKKYEDYLKNHKTIIQLSDDDLAALPNRNNEDVPSLLSAMVQVINVNDDKAESEIYMNGFGGSGISRLFSRFSYLDNEVNEFVKEMNDIQSKKYKDFIPAEIIHLPEDRIGNIQMHPVQRKYGIAYFSNTDLADSDIELIPINDILVSVPYGKRIRLRSMKYKKEIMPFLSTAHNYSGGLPIYLFLCALQNQYCRYYEFRWGEYFSNKVFLPQVRYDNVILSRARWLVRINDIIGTSKYKSGSIDLGIVYDWRRKNNIPNEIEIVEGDNRLYIDFRDGQLTKVFINYLSARKTLTIEEFLFTNTSIPLVKRGKNWFVNELIVCANKENDE